MRWYFILIIVTSTLCILARLFFVTNFKLNSIFPISENTLGKSYTLLARNNARFIELYKKYNAVLNSTPFRTNTLSDKTMIYSCRSFCGGWGDRLRGITSVYILALLTNRRFMIDMNYPCEILRVVQPNLVNWTYIKFNTSTKRTHLTINTMRSWQRSLRDKIGKLIKSEDFAQDWLSYDDVYITTNSDYMTPALRNVHMVNKTRQLLGQIPTSQATMQTLFALLFEILFKPSTAVRQRVDSILSISAHRHLICLHIRVGKNPTNPFDHSFKNRANTTQVTIDFTEKYLSNKSSQIIFVTSDSGQAVSDVLRHYPNSSITIVGPILHIDRFDLRSPTICDGFIKVIADFYLLGECQTSILSPSGFSFWANQRREKPNEELYIYNPVLEKIKKA